MKATWDFYGRRAEEAELRKIAERGRWFFCEISGRRRIGKTALVNRLLDRTKGRKVFYVQIPDSDPSGVLKSVNDALEDLEIPRGDFPPPRDLQQFAKLIGRLAEKEYFVILDEFQNLVQEDPNVLHLLQALVDGLEFSGDEMYIAGDVIRPRAVHNAVREGFLAGVRI